MAPHRSYRRFVPAIALGLLTLLAVVGAWRGERPRLLPRVVHAELRSWIVAGHARHLFLDLSSPREPSVIGRIEYSTVMHRADYRYTLDSTGVPRIGRVQGGVLSPPPGIAPPPDNRVEASYDITLEEARALQRDRVFAKPYVLLGANSNAALRRVMERCGMVLPAHVVNSSGVFGEFPGIDADPGEELPQSRWEGFGVVAARS